VPAAGAVAETAVELVAKLSTQQRGAKTHQAMSSNARHRIALIETFVSV